MSEAKLQPYARHLFVCTGPRCAPGESDALFEILDPRLKDLGLTSGSVRVKRTRSGCFAVCREGPIVVVYPEGVWYRRVTPEALDRILIEHLRDGHPVAELVFHSLANSGVCRAGESDGGAR